MSDQAAWGWDGMDSMVWSLMNQPIKEGQFPLQSLPFNDFDFAFDIPHGSTPQMIAAYVFAWDKVEDLVIDDMMGRGPKNLTPVLVADTFQHHVNESLALRDDPFAYKDVIECLSNYAEDRADELEDAGDEEIAISQLAHALRSEMAFLAKELGHSIKKLDEDEFNELCLMVDTAVALGHHKEQSTNRRKPARVRKPTRKERNRTKRVLNSFYH